MILVLGFFKLYILDTYKLFIKTLQTISSKWKHYDGPETNWRML